MAAVIVRSATPADYPAIAGLTVAAYEADGQVRGTEGYGAMLADVAGRAGAGELLVAAVGDTVLGSVLFVRPGSPYAELSGDGEAEFRMLAVDPAAQGQGVGRSLVNACVDRADAARCTAVVICVRDFSLPARRLYDSFGFVRTPGLDWSPGPGITLWAMRLDRLAARRPG
jgi:ribosomal protein S18 acetylase RimI-like enzyme